MMTAGEVVRIVIAVIENLIAMASALGHRDAAIAAMDAALIAARAKTDADLRAKHERPPGSW